MLARGEGLRCDPARKVHGCHTRSTEAGVTCLYVVVVPCFGKQTVSRLIEVAISDYGQETFIVDSLGISDRRSI